MKKSQILIVLQIVLLGNVIAEGLHRFINEEKYGYFDDALKVVIYPEYSNAYDFHDGFAIVSKRVDGKTRCSVIDEKGNIPFPELDVLGSLIYEGDGIYYNDWDGYLFNVYENEKISVKWNTVRGPYYKIFPKNILLGLNDCLIDSRGHKRKFSEIWRKIYAQVDGAGLVFDKNFEMKIIDNAGNVLLNDLFDCAFNFSEGLMAIETKTKSGFINNKGEFVFECDFVPLVEFNPPSINYFFSEGVAVVQVKNGVYKIFDNRGKVILAETKFKSASLCVDDRILVQDDKNCKFGYLDSKGKLVIPFIFDKSSDFYKGFAYGKINGRDVVIKKDGNYIFSSDLIK